MIHGKTHQLTEEENRLLLTIVAKLVAGLQTILFGTKIAKRKLAGMVKEIENKKNQSWDIYAL